MKFKNYVYETIVIGGTLEAITYAFVENKPLIYVDKKIPFRFDYFDPNLELPFFKLHHERVKILKTCGPDKEVGIPKHLFYQQLCFVLSLAGLVPFEDKVFSLVVDNNLLKVVMRNKAIEVEFEKLVIFDEEKIMGIPSVISKNDKFKTIDWINVRSGMNHQFDYFATDDNFVKEVYFYPSDRIDGKHLNKKDAVAVSYLSEEQLLDIDYSDTYVRFKVLELMKNAGIKGRGNGHAVNDPQKKVYRSLKIETAEREVISIVRSKHSEQDNIFFNHQSAEDIVKDFKPKELYTQKLNQLLFS